MKTVFADTFYWIALANPRDSWHEKASSLSKTLHPFRTITSDEVLVEFLASFSDKGRFLRDIAVKLVRRILDDANIVVRPQTRDSFLEGLRFYESRPDKEYSLTDCISMSIMHRDKISEVLTRDRHFAQEGFKPLLRD
jgi:uncharacterized protein